MGFKIAPSFRVGIQTQKASMPLSTKALSSCKEMFPLLPRHAAHVLVVLFAPRLDLIQERGDRRPLPHRRAGQNLPHGEVEDPVGVDAAILVYQHVLGMRVVVHPDVHVVDPVANLGGQLDNVFVPEHNETELTHTILHKRVGTRNPPTQRGRHSYSPCRPRVVPLSRYGEFALLWQFGYCCVPFSHGSHTSVRFLQPTIESLIVPARDTQVANHSTAYTRGIPCEYGSEPHRAGLGLLEPSPFAYLPWATRIAHIITEPC